MRILTVKLYRGQHRMDVFVARADGKVFQTNYRWQQKDATDLPPEGWEKTVAAEISRASVEDRSVMRIFNRGSW